MRKMGQDVMPGISLEEENPVNVRILAKYHNKMFQARYEMAINGTMFFFKKAVIHSLYEMGKEWACNILQL